MITIACKFEGPDHEFPGDWIFGGANGLDPRADPRWIPTTYIYRNAKLDIVATTQVPLCVDEAIDYFTVVKRWGLCPKFLECKQPGDLKFKMVPVEYDFKTDTARDL